MSDWRQRYLRNRIEAIEKILSTDCEHMKFFEKMRKTAFKDLVQDQIDNFNDE